jgi:hypothetical protein
MIVLNYYKGKFTGLLKPKNGKHHGALLFSAIDWEYLRIDDIEKLSIASIDEYKTGDFWYKEKINTRKRFNLFGNTTQLFIPRGADQYFGESIYQVLLKNFKITPNNSSSYSKEIIEVTGDIYFQVRTKAVAKIAEPAQTFIVEDVNAVNGVNILEGGIVDNTNKTIQTEEPILQPIATPLIPQINKTNKSFNILGTVFWLLFLWFAWKTFPSAILLFLVLGIGWFITRFIGRKILGGIFTFILLFIVFAVVLNLFSRGGNNLAPIKTRQGSVKTSNPFVTEDKNGGNRSQIMTQKSIEWFDFKERNYNATYNTSAQDFEQELRLHQQIADEAQKQPSEEMYSFLYAKMVNLDQTKIDSVVAIFEDSVQNKKLSPIATAEMVVTFIQEIPYYLVHDRSCKEVLQNSGSAFFKEYHRQKKPCLSEVPFGVQSPFEFLHNLKGDCDTRSLLAFAILKKLNIPCSVWISQTYGHSILGVGLPVGVGMYKNVAGVKHYGVELTAKGYKLGAVSPSQNVTSNWEVALSFNN